MSSTTLEPPSTPTNGVATVAATTAPGVTAPTPATPSVTPAAQPAVTPVVTPVPPNHQLPSPTTPPVTRKPLFKRPGFIILLIVLVVLALAGTAMWLHARHYQDTDDAQVDGHIVPMAPQVSARVTTIHIDDNLFVHKGDLLLELDPTDFQAALDQARGAEAAAAGKAQQATADVQSAKSMVTQAQAELDAAQVNLDNAERDLKRYQGLDERAKSQQSQDNATATEKTAVAQVEQAKATLLVNQSKVASAEANVAAMAGDLQKAKADTHRAEVQLGYCRIVAPMDGYVTSKNVDPGQYVTPSNPMFALVSPEVWVIANYKETQLTDMKIGQDVKIEIDAYPDLDLHGKVQSFQSGTGSRFSVIPAENATGNYVKVVQRIPVKIELDPDAIKDLKDQNRSLSPGMSVEATVHVLDGEY